MNKPLLLLGLCLSASACAGPATFAPPKPAATASEHLYLGDDNASGALREYALPLTNASTPLVAIPMDKPFLVTSNATSVAVTTLDTESVTVFARPLSSTSTAQATITLDGSANDPLFLPSGDLAVSDQSSIELYAPPFSNASTVSSTIPLTGISARYLTRDPAGNVYADDSDNTIAVITGSAVTAVATAASGVQYRGLAATASQLFACGFVASPLTDFVDVYTLPLSASSTPAFKITSGVDSPEACSVDSEGNLYVGNTSGALAMYAPPFSSGSTPSVTISTGAIIFGMSVGP